MLRILQVISLVMLWLALAVNIATTVMNVRTRKRLKASCEIMDGLIRDWEEKHKVLEDEDEGQDND